MGLWNRLPGRSAASTPTRPAVQAAVTWAKRPTIAPGGEQHVVGESNYQAALEHAAGGRTPDGCATSLVAAQLVREPRNRYDRNAVRVDIAGQVVGYLPRADAPRYHQLVTALWEQGVAATCWARLTGGWDPRPVRPGQHRARARHRPATPAVRTGGQPAATRAPSRLGHWRGALPGRASHLARARREVSTIGKLRLVDSHLRRPDRGPLVEVEIGGSPMWLTTKMTQRYGPIVQAAADAGVMPVCGALIAPGAGKIEAYIRLPTPELM